MLELVVMISTNTANITISELVEIITSTKDVELVVIIISIKDMVVVETSQYRKYGEASGEYSQQLM